jgi:hypothetical protein
LDGFPGGYIDIGCFVHIEKTIFNDFAEILQAYGNFFEHEHLGLKTKIIENKVNSWFIKRLKVIELEDEFSLWENCPTVNK